MSVVFILFYDAIGTSFMHFDIKETLRELNHKFKYISHEMKNFYIDKSVEEEVETELNSNSYDVVLTINFIPLIARICYKHDIPYKAWCYDAPMNLVNDACFEFPTNAVYTFDREDYMKYKRLGHDTVHLLNLATNTNRLNKIRPDYAKYGSDISFIGQLYESNLSELKSHMDDFDRGYVEGIIAAQRRVYDKYFIPDVINIALNRSVNKIYESQNEMSHGRQTLNFAVSSYLTEIDRLSLLRFASKIGKTRFYTLKISDKIKRLIPDVIVSGYLDYWKEFPVAVKSTSINLCPILRNIKSGIPLRVLDIMGCGAFQLVSFQPELAESFTEGKDVVMYSSIEEANDKMKYYLQHEGERKHIAAAGYERVKNEYRFDKALRIILGEEELPPQP